MASTTTKEMIALIIKMHPEINQFKKELLISQLNGLVGLSKAELWIDIKRDVSIATNIAQVRK